MPEAIAVVGVFVVCCFIYVIAKLQARDPELRKPSVVLEQLAQQQAWLEERLRQAERENWSGEMKKPIADELEVNLRKQAQLGPVAEAQT